MFVSGQGFPIYEVGDRVVLRRDIMDHSCYTNTGYGEIEVTHGDYVNPAECFRDYAGKTVTIAHVDNFLETDGLVYYTIEELGGGFDPFEDYWLVCSMFDGLEEVSGEEISTAALTGILF